MSAHSPCFLSFNPSLFRSFTDSHFVTRYQCLPTHPASSPLTLHSSDHSLIQTLSHATMLPVAAHSLCFFSFNPSLFRSFTLSDIVTCYQWLPTHPASSPITLNLQIIHSFRHCLMLPVAAHSPCFLSFNPSLFRSFTHSDIVTCKPVATHSPCFLSFNTSLFRSFTHSDIVTC